MMSTQHGSTVHSEHAGRTGRQRALWITTAAVGAVVVMAVVWLFAMARPGVDLLAVEETSDVLVAELSSAGTTSEVRAAAVAAQGHATDLQAQLDDADISEEEALVAGAHLQLWEQIARLDALSGATLDQWDDAQASLAASAEGLGETGAAATAASAATAIDALDTLVADAREALQAWELERDAVLAARASNAAAAAAVQQYRGTVVAQLDLYEVLRARTTGQVQPLYDPAVGNEAAWDVREALILGAKDREQIQAVVSALAVPAGLQAEHSRILLALQDAVQAMRSALDGIDEAMAVRYAQWGWETPAPFDIRATAGWQQFSAESARLDAEVPAMRTALEERTTVLLSEYQEVVPIPAAPVV